MAPLRILIVCSGNICRSPMAEVVVRALDDRLAVDSAGTGSWHEGQPMDPRALDALARAGFDGSGHVARQVKPNWLAERDLVLAADRGHRRELRRLAAHLPGAAPIRLLGEFAGETDAPDIPDPYSGGPRNFTHCLALIERCCATLVTEHLSDRRP
jgi:protein-tyrosine phosphatase